MCSSSSSSAAGDCVTRATRLRTYAIKGPAGSGVVCANGAAAHLVRRGDLVIVATFTMMDDVQARLYRPRLVFVDEHNRIRPVQGDDAEAVADLNQLST